LFTNSKFEILKYHVAAITATDSECIKAISLVAHERGHEQCYPRMKVTSEE